MTTAMIDKPFESPELNDLIGNDPAVDFLNTVRDTDGSRDAGASKAELLTSPEVLARFAARVGVISDGEAASLLAEPGGGEAELARARAFREAWRWAALRLEHGAGLTDGFVEELNALLSARPGSERFVAADGDGFTRRWTIAPGDWGGVTPAFAAAVARFLERADLGRFRACANEACVHHFYDTSKNGRRRFCRSGVCGNRVKVARFRAKQKEAGGG